MGAEDIRKLTREVAVDEGNILERHCFLDSLRNLPRREIVVVEIDFLLRVHQREEVLRCRIEEIVASIIITNFL